MFLSLLSRERYILCKIIWISGNCVYYCNTLIIEHYRCQQSWPIVKENTNYTWDILNYFFLIPFSLLFSCKKQSFREDALVNNTLNEGFINEVTIEEAEKAGINFQIAGRVLKKIASIEKRKPTDTKKIWYESGHR